MAQTLQLQVARADEVELKPIPVPSVLNQEATMSHRHNNLEFVAHFVDAVTVRPLLADLRRMRRAADVFRRKELPAEQFRDRAA